MNAVVQFKQNIALRNFYGIFDFNLDKFISYSSLNKIPDDIN